MIRSWNKLNKNESGQAALEAAIILIAFVVVASVFAFAVLSAGQASTSKGEQAIYSGLQQVQASLEIKGAVIAEGDSTGVSSVIFTVATVSGGDPINLADGQTILTGDTTAPPAVVVISYSDATQRAAYLPFTVTWIVHNGTNADHLLENGELAQITVNVNTTIATPAGLLTKALGANTPFTLEVKPPTGAVLQISRTTPAALQSVMELR